MDSRKLSSGKHADLCDIPTTFPEKHALSRMDQMKENRASGKFLKKFEVTEVK